MNKVAIKYTSISILENINITFEKNKTYIIIGDNGEGKTTFVKCISSALIPIIGEVCLYDDNNKRYFYNKNKDLKYIRKNISVMLGGYTSLLPNLTCIQNIIFFITIKNIMFDGDKIEYYLKLFDIKQYEDIVTYRLSTGTKQKIVLIITILTNASILIFDEPTTGLDQSSINVFKNEIEKIKKEKIIIMTTHDKSLLNNNSVVLSVKDKKVEILKSLNF